LTKKYILKNFISFFIFLQKTIFLEKEIFFENFNTSENNITGVELAKVLGYLV
jgi:hypothetical protein